MNSSKDSSFYVKDAHENQKKYFRIGNDENNTKVLLFANSSALGGKHFDIL